jgi:hypothetical protein
MRRRRCVLCGQDGPPLSIRVASMSKPFTSSPRRRVFLYLIRNSFFVPQVEHPFATHGSRLARLPNANTDPPNHLRLTPGGSPMPTVKLRASTILGELEQAQTELVGKAVILTDGKAGTVERVWLDEMHGLRISIRGHHGKWPISTIQFAQPG